uniref:RNA-binding S4 domain-containing protein n=1 Tax=Solanum lycopersicum TaxID=4081 RepID=A0A3Q7FKD7_SOLLC
MVNTLIPIVVKKPRTRSYLVNKSHYGKRKLNIYGLTEQRLLKYVRIARKSKPFRLGMASTIPIAHKLVNHRHILVNAHIVDIPSYRSIALIQISLASSPREELPNHLESLVVEYYKYHT